MRFYRINIFSFCELFPATTKKTDTTAQLYCTLSMCVTLKTISRQNQKTNTPPQLYCTLSSTCVCRSNPFPHQNQKTDTTQQHNRKKGSSSPRKASVFVSLSVICLFYTYTYVEMSHQLFILFLRERK